MPQGISLLEVGCGTGSFMLRCSPQIAHGLGVDLNASMVDYANKQRTAHNIKNVHFECVNALHMAPSSFDIASSTLCLHELAEKDACQLLSAMLKTSKQVIIADYGYCKSLAGRCAIELDEMLSGHYRNFKLYQKKGAIPAYVKQIGARIEREYASDIEGIYIWVIQGKIS
ncbi:hypothetical protein MARGE09_P0122 [Marinagarivorans cellulosilyticus]|uniref:Methyltransferase domain-containing protein n=2 Tax=Marinagarivorans cellulosilyticus TaxID=2721545 RepID=A0AAN1WE53_9GAMM|nr:hypothetical protein MARGE09_P0122 [Marinagarivorans cellulosilyticus]